MTHPATDYFEHDADIGIVGRGRTVEEAFENAARAMVAVSTGGPVEPASDDGAESEVGIAFTESDPELALFAWLNLIVAEAAARRLRLSRFHLERHGDAWRGVARGRPWRPDEERGTEVKGATLTMLSVAQRDGAWEARCIVDV